MKDKLIEILKDFRTPICEGLNAKLPDVEGLADHLLAAGVIVPPCKVGDMVWIAGEYRGVYSATVRTFFFSHSGVEMIRTTKCDIPFSDFGKVVFLTRKEAEQALKEAQR